MGVDLSCGFMFLKHVSVMFLMFCVDECVRLFVCCFDRLYGK